MYTFQNGYYVAKSERFLTQADYEVLKADPLYFDVLKNKGFGQSEDIQSLYTSQIVALRQDLLRTLEHKEVVKLFFYHIDATNTKIIYKHIYHGIEMKTEEGGNIRPLAIYNALKHQDYGGILESDVFIFEDILQCRGSVKEVDERIDALFLKRKYALAVHKELKEYLDIEVTLSNILILLRGKEIGLSKEACISALMPYGDLDKKEALSLYGEEEKMISFVSGLYSEHVGAILSTYFEDRDLEKVYNHFQRETYKILKPYSYEPFGFGIIMTYVYRKFVELENIKTLYFDRSMNIEDLVIL